MSFDINEKTQAGKLSRGPTSFSKNRKDRCAGGDHCRSEDGVSSSLERALVTTDRDSALRRKYLHNRWQGAIEKLESRDELRLRPTGQEWWNRRLGTPLGRALMRLNSK
jgi:hypothetical protein